MLLGIKASAFSYIAVPPVDAVSGWPLVDVARVGAGRILSLPRMPLGRN
jgi:hypothetical protein